MGAVVPAGVSAPSASRCRMASASLCRASRVVDVVPPHGRVGLAGPVHAVRTAGLDSAQVHQLEVDAMGVAVLLALDFGRVGAERLEQRTQPGYLAGVLAGDRARRRRPRR